MEHPFFPTTTTRAEALRWLTIAEKLLSARDLMGSKSFATRARDSDPTLSPADQILAVVDTLLAGDRRIGNNQQDWYAILRLTPQQGPNDDIPAPGQQFAQFRAGCFWGVELAYQRVPGVSKTEVGYTQGYLHNPTYEEVFGDLHLQLFMNKKKKKEKKEKIAYSSKEFELIVKQGEATPVPPAEETEKGLYFLSNLDRNIAVIVRTIYCFKSEEKGNEDAVSVIKNALSKVLVHFYPSAGRLTISPEMKLIVDCTGEGAVFVEAEEVCKQEADLQQSQGVRSAGKGAHSIEARGEVERRILCEP